MANTYFFMLDILNITIYVKNIFYSSIEWSMFLIELEGVYILNIESTFYFFI